MNEHDVKSLVSDLSSIDGIFVSETFPVRTRKYAQGYRVYAKYIFDDQEYAQNLETLVKNGCDKNTVLDDRGECVKKFMDSVIRSIIDKYSNLNISVNHKLWGIAGHDVWDEVTLTVKPASGIVEDLETELEIPTPYNQYYEFSPNEVNFDELPDAFDHYKELKVVAELYAKEQYEDALADNCLDFCWLVEDEVGKLLLVTTAGLRVYPITLEEIQDCVGEPSYDDDYDDYDDEDLDEAVELTDAQRLALQELDTCFECGELDAEKHALAYQIQWDINFEDVLLFINGVDIDLKNIKHVGYGDCEETKFDGCYSVTLHNGQVKRYGWHDFDMNGSLTAIEDCDEGILSNITGMAPIGLAEDLEYEFKPTELEKAKAEVFKLNGVQRFKEDEALPQIYALYKELRAADSNENTSGISSFTTAEDFLQFYRTVQELKRQHELYVSSWDTEKRDRLTGAASVKFKSSSAKDKLMSESACKNEAYACVDAKDFINHPMNYDVTSMLDFEVQDDVKVYIHRGPGRQREFYIIIGDTYVQHSFNKLETVEKYLRRNNLVKENISEAFKPGDVVYVTVCNRQGRVRKMISPDVVEVELHDNGVYPERIDRYYVDEVELQYSDDLDDEF